jgi:hypothetical protein
VWAVSNRGRIATLLTLTFHPMFDLALDLIEGPVDRRVGVLKVALPRRRVRDEHLVSRKADVDRETILIHMAVMMPGELDHDVARDDAVEDVVELPGALPKTGCEGVRVRHASERELKRCLHWGVSVVREGAGFMRAGHLVVSRTNDAEEGDENNAAARTHPTTRRACT